MELINFPVALQKHFRLHRHSSCISVAGEARICSVKFTCDVTNATNSRILQLPPSEDTGKVRLNELANGVPVFSVRQLFSTAVQLFATSYFSLRAVTGACTRITLPASFRELASVRSIYLIAARMHLRQCDATGPRRIVDLAATINSLSIRRSFGDRKLSVYQVRGLRPDRRKID